MEHRNTRARSMASISPQQNPPSPSLQDFHVAFAHGLASFDFGAQFLDSLLDGPGHSQRHLVLEDVQHGEDEEGHACKPALAKDAVSDAGQQALGSPEGVLGVIGGLQGLLV